MLVGARRPTSSPRPSPRTTRPLTTRPGHRPQGAPSALVARAARQGRRRRAARQRRRADAARRRRAGAAGHRGARRARLVGQAGRGAVERVAVGAPPTPTSPPTCAWPCASCGRDCAERDAARERDARGARRADGSYEATPGSSTPGLRRRPSSRRGARCGRRRSPSSSASRGCASSCSSCSRPPAARQRPADHILLSGPPGLGKTTLAMIVAARERAAAAASPAGPAIQHAGDLAAMLSSLERGRRAVHRRDPPHGALRRGDALPRDGGLPRRRHRRQGPRGDRDPARARAVHARRRDDPVRAAARPAARPVRLHRAPGLLRARRAGAGAAPVRRDARRRAADEAGARRSPAAPAARRASPTGCCAACATTPRCAATASSTRDVAWPHSRSTTSTSSASTGSTAPCSTRSCRRFGGGPVGLSHARGRGRRGGRHGRDGRRAVPGARRVHGPHARGGARCRRRRAPGRHLGARALRSGSILAAGGACRSRAAPRPARAPGGSPAENGHDAAACPVGRVRNGVA